jgi:hypothetical protein
MQALPGLGVFISLVVLRTQGALRAHSNDFILTGSPAKTTPKKSSPWVLAVRTQIFLERTQFNPEEDSIPTCTPLKAKPTSSSQVEAPEIFIHHQGRCKMVQELGKPFGNSLKR